MFRWTAAIAVVSGALVLPQRGYALSTMCAEPAFAVSVELEEPLPSAAEPGTEGELPWCASLDDSRCAPRHDRHGATYVSPHQPLAMNSSGAPVPGMSANEQRRTPVTGLAARTGDEGRVERPPRGHRRSR